LAVKAVVEAFLLITFFSGKQQSRNREIARNQPHGSKGNFVEATKPRKTVL